MKELADVLGKDRSPHGATRPAPVLDPSLQRHLTNFSLISHGFGAPAIVAALAAVQNYLTEMIRSVDRRAAAAADPAAADSAPGAVRLVGPPAGRDKPDPLRK